VTGGKTSHNCKGGKPEKNFPGLSARGPSASPDSEGKKKADCLHVKKSSKAKGKKTRKELTGLNDCEKNGVKPRVSQTGKRKD